MRNNLRSFLTILFFNFSEIELAKAAEDKKLYHKQIVDSAQKHYPKILSYYEKVNISKGEALASLGFFDIKLKQNYVDKSRGFYDGKTTDTLLEKELGTLGAKVYGGYRKSFGSFADYDGGSYTNSGGEYRAGVSFSLLRDSTIDQNRLGVILSNLGIEESKIQLEAIKREIERDATKAYWKWVTSAKIAQIYEELYQLSLKRQKQLEERLKKGDVAKIIVIENRKNILRRKSALAKAKQNFENSAIYLSLFWRDERSLPVIPNSSQVPEIDFLIHEVKNEKVDRDLHIALSNRPELRILKIQQQQGLSELKYAKNLHKPQLDIEFGSSKDLGNGPESRAQSKNYVGLNLSIPLQQREAKGNTAKYQSKLKSLRLEKRMFEDQIKAELEQIKVRINAIVEMHENLVEEANLAKLLEDSEHERFKYGASNFFLVNLREQDTAASKAAVIDMFANYQNALADYKIAVFND